MRPSHGCSLARADGFFIMSATHVGDSLAVVAPKVAAPGPYLMLSKVRLCSRQDR